MVPSAPRRTASAWAKVRAFEGRPDCPRGTEHSSTTFRLTLSRAIARLRSSGTQTLELLRTERTARPSGDSQAQGFGTGYAVATWHIVLYLAAMTDNRRGNAA